MNSSAFQKKLVGIQDSMLNFASMLTTNRDDANDLVQETTLKVLENQDLYSDNMNLKGWVLTIMRNIFINNYQKITERQKDESLEADLSKLEVINESILESIDDTFSVQEITQAIESLPKDLKVPFSMYIQGYQYNGIAEALHIPLGTVKSRIFFARQEMHSRLKKNDQPIKE